MGIHDFLLRYYRGDKFCFGFTSLCFRSERIVLDVAGLLFACAIRHADSYAVGDYTLALQDVHRQLIYLNNTLHWDMVVVLDGSDSPLKRHERARRDRSRTCLTAPTPAPASDETETASTESASTPSVRIQNTPIYIALVAKICRESYIDYVISP
jgi:hypothetical protein